MSQFIHPTCLCVDDLPNRLQQEPQMLVPEDLALADTSAQAPHFGKEAQSEGAQSCWQYVCLTLDHQKKTIMPTFPPAHPIINHVHNQFCSPWYELLNISSALKKLVENTSMTVKSWVDAIVNLNFVQVTSDTPFNLLSGKKAVCFVSCPWLKPWTKVINLQFVLIHYHWRVVWRLLTLPRNLTCTF